MSRKFSFLALFCLLCLTFSSCGYRSGPEEKLSARYSTISIPYVEGDIDGSLTAAIIKAVVRSGIYEYRPTHGAVILTVSQLKINEENIGFRYDRKKRGNLTKDTIPTEERITATVEVSLTDYATGCIVLGPVCITSSIDYDHDYYFSRNGVNIFSLGQLIDLEEAYDAVQPSLNASLAQKIVEYISEGW